MKNKLVSLFSFIGVLVFVLVGCGSNDTGLLTNPYRQSEFVIGTLVTLSIYDEGKEDVLDLAFDRIEELENMFSEEIPESEVSLINDQAGVEPVSVSDELFELIEDSIAHGELSDGLFDVTIGRLTSMWRIGHDDARVPERDEIDAVLPLVNYENMIIDEQEQTVYLAEEGMRLDLGGIAKGYIGDEVGRVMVENGVTSGIIDLGGDVYVIGNRPTGDDWNIGIQNPFLSRGEIIGRVGAQDMAVITSGIYERYIEKDGERYHHLLSPKDGYPINNEIAGVTILVDSLVDGDALATTVYAKGVEEGMQLIESLDDVEGFFVTKDRDIIMSSNASERFELLNDDFNIVK